MLGYTIWLNKYLNEKYGSGKFELPEYMDAYFGSVPEFSYADALKKLEHYSGTVGDLCKLSNKL